MRNLALDGGQAGRGAQGMPPGLAGLTQGLVLTNDAATDTAQAHWVHRATGWVAPPFTTTRIAPAPVRPAATETRTPEGQTAAASRAQQQPGTQPAFATGFGSVFGAAGTQSAERAPMQNSLFGQAELTRGADAGADGFTRGPTAPSGSAAGRSLFSLGADGVPVQQQALGTTAGGSSAGPSRGMFGFQVGKKPRTEDW